MILTVHFWMHQGDYLKGLELVGVASVANGGSVIEQGSKVDDALILGW